MSKSIFIGNIANQTTEESLSALFTPFTKVLSIKIIKKDDGRVPFGFIEVDDADLEKAVNGVNGMELDGNKLTVNEARARVERNDRDNRMAA